MYHSLLLGPDGTGTSAYNFSERLNVRLFEPREGTELSVIVPSGKENNIVGSVRSEFRNGFLRVYSSTQSIGIDSVKLYSSKYKVEAAHGVTDVVHDKEISFVVKSK